LAHRSYVLVFTDFYLILP